MEELTKVEPKGLTIAIPEGALTSIHEQKRIRTDRFIRTYANSVAISITQWDVSLIFGEITGQKDEDDKPVIEETVQMVLTREVVKALTGILMGQISAYEQQVGEIKLPASPSPSVSPSASPSRSPSASVSPSMSPSASASPSPKAPDDGESHD